jgi:hypothetical protein
MGSDCMKIEGNTIIFKSAPEYYYKEFQGWKPNTIRRFSSIDELNKFNYFKNHLTNNSKIRIEHTGNEKELNFTRYITDITQFEGYFIISWRHE